MPADPAIQRLSPNRVRTGQPPQCAQSQPLGAGDLERQASMLGPGVIVVKCHTGGSQVCRLARRLTQPSICSAGGSDARAGPAPSAPWRGGDGAALTATMWCTPAARADVEAALEAVPGGCCTRRNSGAARLAVDRWGIWIHGKPGRLSVLSDTQGHVKSGCVDYSRARGSFPPAPATQRARRRQAGWAS